MPKAGAIHDVIAKIYDCALDPARWQDTLVDIAATFNANGAGLHHHDFRGAQWNVMTQVGFSQPQVAAYSDYYHRVDPRLAAGQRIAAGDVLVDGMHISEAEMDRDEFYQDFLAPSDMRYYASALLANSSDRVAVLTLQRSARAGAISHAERRSIAQLIPHLQRGLLVQRTLAGARVRERMVLALLDDLQSAVMVIGADGRPLLMNREAEALVAAQDGLWSGPDGVRGARAEATAALRQMIADALLGRIERAASSVKLPRPGDKPPLIAWVAPMREALSLELALSGAHILLFVSDPARRAKLRLAPAFVALYGLTPAETRLLEALLNGATVHSASAAFGVSGETVRTQLKALFAKTGTVRQIDLIRLVLAAQLYSAERT